MANISPYNFIVVLPQTIIEIPQSSNLSWLTLFYALSKELVEKRAEYLGLLRLVGVAIFPDTPSGRNTP